MPNWKIHLEVGKRVANNIKFNEKDYEFFMLGNILPDINNRYIVENIKKQISHKVTHFDYNNKTHENFFNIYKEKISEPIVLGYYVHLFTDYIWNNDFYTSIVGTEFEKLDKDTLRELKQSDFRNYNNLYVDNQLIINNLDESAEKTKIINEVNLNKDDLIDTINYLKGKIFYDTEYSFYSEEYLNNLLEYTIKTITNELNNILK